jgi:hypothetical protein
MYDLFKVHYSTWWWLFEPKHVVSKLCITKYWPFMLIYVTSEWYCILLFCLTVNQSYINMKNGMLKFRSVHKSPQLVPILSQTNPATFLNHVYLIFAVILSSHLRLDLLNDLFRSGFPTKILYAFLISHTSYMPHSFHNPWFYHPILCKQLLNMRYNTILSITSLM